MKFVTLAIAFAFMAVVSPAQAAETSAASALVTGSKSYQSRAISDVRPTDAKDSSQPAVNPVSVEPAAGAEADGEMQEGRDAIRSLQDQMKLPRKN